MSLPEDFQFKNTCKHVITKQPSDEDNKQSNDTETQDSSFEQYHTLCKLYWQEKENNELKTKDKKTFNNKLPPTPEHLSLCNRTILINDYHKHKNKMLYLVQYTIDQLKSQNPITFEQWISQQLQLPEDCQPCPCCQYSDYIGFNTIVHMDEH